MFWKGLILIPVAGAALALVGKPQVQQHAGADFAPGQLAAVGRDGKVGALCPLEKTVVNANVSAFAARVSVNQVFHNPTDQTIEAVYTFPLPDNAAVDHMKMVIGDRVIEGTIKEREQARRIYNAAMANGQAAALLDQERPNIFTQSVANITPGATVNIEIDYVQTLKFQDGTFEFNFPMVVGPRFLGNAPDPGKISPPITPPGTRTGTNIELNVDLDAGAPIQDVKSVLHEIETQRVDDHRYHISLAKRDEIPNRDFILRYQVATDQVTDAFVTHMDGTGKGGFFAMAILPPKAPTEQDIAPKEVYFVMDQSGSQSGFPIAKSKELTLKLIKTLRPNDTFNVFGFNNTVRSLWPESRSVTPTNLAEASEFVKSMDAAGGTQLLEGLKAALGGKKDPGRLRIVVFNTDGFVGDEKAILDTMQKNREAARVFTFGIGGSVNRYLIDSLSAEGRGAAEYVTLPEQAEPAVARFIQRTRTPVLTDVSMETDGIQVEGVQPAYLPDAFDQSPIYLFGRYSQPSSGRITLRGMHGGRPWSKTIDVELPMRGNSPAIESLWARQQVDDLTRQNYLGQFDGKGKDLGAATTDVALEFGIMSPYTSFVAVEERVINVGGRQRHARVPVEMADGVSYGGVEDRQKQSLAAPAMAGTFNAGVAMGGGGGARSVARQSGVIRRIYPTGRVSNEPASKIAKPLQNAKGTVEVQVWLSGVGPEVMTALKTVGLKVELEDQKLKIVFGTIDAAKLKALSELEAVDRIEPLEG